MRKKIFLLICCLTTLVKAEYIKINATGAGSSPKNVASGNVSIAIGTNTEAKQLASIAIGHGSSSSSEGSLAIGWGAKALKNHSISLGTTAESKVENGIAIGNFSKAIRDKEEYGFNVLKDKKLSHLTEVETDLKKLHVWQGSLGAFSIGDVDNMKTRQITGLAAGTLDSDAVNIAQLRSLSNAPVRIYLNDNEVTSLKLRDMNFKFSDDFNVTKDGDNKVLISLKEKDANINRDNENITVINGRDGKSAYEIWKELDEKNKDKSEKDFIESLKPKFDEKKLNKALSGVSNAISLALMPNSNNGLTMGFGGYENNYSFAIGLSGKLDKFGYKGGMSVNTKGNIAGGLGISIDFEDEKKENIFEEIENLKKENTKLRKMLEDVLKKI